MIDLSIICVDAGKSYITYYMLKSLLKLQLNCNIYVLCNKENTHLSLLDEFKESVNIIYDFKLIDSDIPIYQQHTISVKKLLSYIKTKYVFLCDNDVLFTNDFKKYLDIYQNYDIITAVEDPFNSIKYFVKDAYMYDNKIICKDENESNIYLNNPYYNNLKLISNKNNLYTFIDSTNPNIKFEWFNRFLPYHIFLNTDKISHFPFTDYNFEIGYSVSTKKCYDSFSTITYNALLNNLNILYTDFTNSVIHVRSATWYRDHDAYITRLQEIISDYPELNYLLDNV